ncbi:hypothetical protein CpipJ_CPIJ012167 [Culex quinquefasciatus]|uniref:Uncharacterized protein n=1 Tax=Culex quinquefasciatus TaxID=7176 RepID=B0WY39_CULQU|nr:hypothetical protein CpipJ_CPIJ012167 [Culex quinquefasciatus]|eukprot:XP_001862311.1 hypothetical protein CpipJ_CPIJ012167 [Culex quinquefasciatus]
MFLNGAVAEFLEQTKQSPRGRGLESMVTKVVARAQQRQTPDQTHRKYPLCCLHELNEEIVLE